MTDEPTLTSPDIGRTENALRAVLQKVLRGTALDYHAWVALNVVSNSTPPISAGALRGVLAGGLKIDGATAVAVVDGLQTQGVLERAGDDIVSTWEGRALYRRLDDEVRRVTTLIYDGFDTEDLVVAHRVLSTITERANAILAA
jgi:DNA-binding MarR family transcriptional regulator